MNKHFIPWRKLNALTMVGDLEVQEVPTASYCKECKTFTDLKFHHYNGFMTGYFPEGVDNDNIEEFEKAVDDFEWWEQFDIEHRVSLKPMDGGLAETAHPWSELRKYTIQGLEMLKQKIEEGKQAEKLLAKVVPNLTNLNIMVNQEQQTEEAQLARMVK